MPDPIPANRSPTIRKNSYTTSADLTLSLADRLIDHTEETEPDIELEYQKELLPEENTIRESPDNPPRAEKLSVRVEYCRGGGAEAKLFFQRSL
ncbi:hypothetical protein CBE89_04535 [Corynebacterium striatum]|uniref:Uncharacterized protein n=1 Tax=Corynebacterium striatum TaxID=43770 RepID=A0A2Z2IXB7_CORST|nr:hypothetical protein CBE89_04535 [Corynebacterium striatum]